MPHINSIISEVKRYKCININKNGKMQGSINCFKQQIVQGSLKDSDFIFIINRIKLEEKTIPTVESIRDRLLYGLDMINDFYCYRDSKLKHNGYFKDYINDLKKLIGKIIDKKFLYSHLIEDEEGAKK